MIFSAPAAMPAVPVAGAMDPIGLFVLLVIIINVIAGLKKAAQRKVQTATQQTASIPPTPPAPPRPNPAASAWDTAARTAERARLQQALDAMKARAAAVAAPARAPTPTPAQAAPSLAAPLPSGQLLTAIALDTQAAMPAQGYGLLAGAMPPVGGMLVIPGFGAPVSAAQLFVGAAVVGPCAALRQAGHTPAGW